MEVEGQYNPNPAECILGCISILLYVINSSFSCVIDNSNVHNDTGHVTVLRVHKTLVKKDLSNNHHSLASQIRSMIIFLSTGVVCCFDLLYEMLVFHRKPSNRAVTMCLDQCCSHFCLHFTTNSLLLIEQCIECKHNQRLSHVPRMWDGEW